MYLNSELLTTDKKAASLSVYATLEITVLKGRKPSKLSYEKCDMTFFLEAKKKG